MKGLILCAGRGTRMQPFSNTMPKTLLPVANRPLLHYCIEKLNRVGITEIGVVINPQQKSIIEFLDRIQFPSPIEIIKQTRPLGIANAVQKAKAFIGDDPFVLLLGDNLICEELHMLVDASRGHDSAILLSRVENPSDYGIAEIEDGKIHSLVEKPKAPKSDLAVIGAYVFQPTIFDVIAKLKRSARGEYEITDAIQQLISDGYSVSFSVTDKPYSDVGTLERWIVANGWMLNQVHGDQVKIGQNTTVENCTIRGPVLIGENCLLQNVVIGPYVSVQDGVSLRDCEIADSICLEDASICGIGVKIVQSVFGRSTNLQGEGETKKVTFMLGDHSQVTFPIDHKE
ncbi:glucose-1-phosphate thymidylyltransferase [Tumebacillus algifaecis]|uniref:Glucose-1-phosphate thymidylyltransferase n=1 Tax=Tumebacillus algifaecis TaxID=1214604 RepID=A0A223D0K2_9BACL|nr:glucose-1-phosphate thymidylyltransferase [Tumebacillus algifaecis]ASS75142.1 glucose-1-phosphate thymidylyltransferase [Tumebacillus algifaecis]